MSRLVKYTLQIGAEPQPGAFLRHLFAASATLRAQRAVGRLTSPEPPTTHIELGTFTWYEYEGDLVRAVRETGGYVEVTLHGETREGDLEIFDLECHLDDEGHVICVEWPYVLKRAAIGTKKTF